jgi:hypothetical protein
MNAVSENIDERILRLLNLEDVFDLDYDTYFNLIREAMVLGANKIPQEELAILANERKRIRGKKGRFKPKKQKITADKIATTKLLKGSKKVSILPAAISKPDISQDNLTGIGKPLQSISKTLSDFLKFRKKSSEEERREKESQKRTKKEEGLEGLKKGISAISGAAKKMLAPFQGIIDRIWRFIFFTLLGRAFTQLMDWLGDPANKRKIEVLGRFLKDWWPTLLGAAVLFLTPFGGFVRKTLGLVGFFTGRLVKLIPGIAKAVKGLALNPWFAVPAAALGLSAAANEVTGQRKAAAIQSANKARAQTGKGLGVQGVGGVGDMGPTTPYRMLQGAASGGQILKFVGGGINPGNGYEGIDSSTGQKVSGFGPDTQMIVAQPGEIVMNKKTVDAVGADNLLSLNRQYGGPGANKPKMGRLYNTGGIVGGGEVAIPSQGFQGGGLIGSLGRFLPGTGTVMAPKTIGNQTVAGYQDQLLGINIGKTRYPKDTSGYGTGYSAQQMKRYEQVNTKKQFVNRGGTLPALVNRENFVGNAFKNFGSNVRTIQGAARRQEEMMRQMGYTPDGYVNLLGQPIKRQGGGEIPQGPFTPLPSPGYVRPQGSFIPRPLLRLPGPMPGTTVPFGYNPFRGLMGGGLIKENTGMNIRGATADRQLAALQPGEYVLPVDTVNRLGTSLIDKLVANTDSNSNPFKKSVNKPRITPLPRGQGNMITLPPITQGSSGSGGSGSFAGSKVPSFSAVSSSGSAERSMNASIYGIVG